jgi:pyruvate/2-oxoacid:ferredoxin oxidoreductase beta subunit
VAVNRASTIDGPAYLHVQTPCATGWRFAPRATVEVARMAVVTGAWPLFEVDHGHLKVTRKVKPLKPMRDYLSLQGRYRGVPDETVERLEKQAADYYQKLLATEESQ